MKVNNLLGCFRFSALKVVIAALFCCLIMLSCEISHSVPYDFPSYKPELVIHAVASPQSGARALIKYNQPLYSFPGETPDLPPLIVYLLQDGKRIHRFQHDSISIATDNSYENIETAYFSIRPDSLNLMQHISYSLQVINQNTQQQYQSSKVFLPPEPSVKMFDIVCPSSSENKCYVSADLGNVNEAISAISINGHYLDTALIDEYFQPYNSRLFNSDLIYPEVDSWNHYLATSSFTQVIRNLPDTVENRLNVRVSIAYLSQDIAQLNREINGTHAIGEDIFAALQPFHSNFNKAFGIFGLYNEDIRIIKL